MARRLLSLLTAVSLLLFLATLVLWVRSYFVQDFVAREYDQDEAPGLSVSRITSFTSSWGGLAVVRSNIIRSGDPDAVSNLSMTVRRRTPVFNGWTRDKAWTYPVPAGAHTLGFAWESGRDDQSFPFEGDRPMRFRAWTWWLTVPYWFPAALTGCSLVPSGLKLRALLRRRSRARRHQCPRCGYDIRATPSKCPECGNASAPTAA